MTGLRITPSELEQSGSHLEEFGSRIDEHNTKLGSTHQRLAAHVGSDRSGVGKVLGEVLDKTEAAFSKEGAQLSRVVKGMGTRVGTTAKTTRENETDVKKSIEDIRPNGDNDKERPRAEKPTGPSGGSTRPVGTDLGDPRNVRDKPTYKPSDAEQAWGNHRIVDIRPIGRGKGVNDAHLVSFEDGSVGVYKPVSGENISVRQGIPGNLAGREVAASRVDELLGFGKVPTTTLMQGPHGMGSVQRFVQSKGGKLDLDKYPQSDREQLGVLDYIIGNSDRHSGNYRTGQDGGIVAIDHGYSFPETPDPEVGIRSSFTYDNVNKPLSDGVMAKIRAADPAAVRSALESSGISDQATQGALARLGELKQNGMITGEQWPGVINDRALDNTAFQHPNFRRPPEPPSPVSNSDLEGLSDFGWNDYAPLYASLPGDTSS